MLRQYFHNFLTLIKFGETNAQPTFNGAHIDHTSLNNAGTNTHAQIDSELAKLPNIRRQNRLMSVAMG